MGEPFRPTPPEADRPQGPDTPLRPDLRVVPEQVAQTGLGDNRVPEDPADLLVKTPPHGIPVVEEGPGGGDDGGGDGPKDPSKRNFLKIFGLGGAAFVAEETVGPRILRKALFGSDPKTTDTAADAKPAAAPATTQVTANPDVTPSTLASKDRVLTDSELLVDVGYTLEQAEAMIAKGYARVNIPLGPGASIDVITPKGVTPNAEAIKDSINYFSFGNSKVTIDPLGTGAYAFEFSSIKPAREVFVLLAGEDAFTDANSKFNPKKEPVGFTTGSKSGASTSFARGGKLFDHTIAFVTEQAQRRISPRISTSAGDPKPPVSDAQKVYVAGREIIMNSVGWKLTSALTREPYPEGKTFTVFSVPGVELPYLPANSLPGGTLPTQAVFS